MDVCSNSVAEETNLKGKAEPSAAFAPNSMAKPMNVTGTRNMEFSLTLANLNMDWQK